MAIFGTDIKKYRGVYANGGRTDPRRRSRGVIVRDPSDHVATARGRTSQFRARPAVNTSTRRATTRGRTSENRASPAQSVNKLKEARELRERIQRSMREKKGLGGFVGGVVGGGIGLIAGNPMMGVGIGRSLGSQFDKEKAPEAEEQFTRGSGHLGNYAYGGYKPYAYGGKKNDLYATGGYASRMKGKGHKITGRGHSQGGVKMSADMEVEGGETMDKLQGGGYVFSDRLKVPGTKETFSKRHEKLISMGGSEKAIQNLADMQERVSGRQGRQLGNPVKKATGGPTDEVTVTADRAFPRYKPIQASTFNQGPTPPEAGLADVPETPDYSPSKGLNVNWGDALQVAPDVINLATGIFGKDKTEEPTQVARSKIATRPVNYNINPELQASSRAYRGILATPGSSSQERLAALSMKGQRDAGAYARKANVETEMGERRSIRQAGLDSNRNAQQASMDSQARQDRMISDANLGISGNMSRAALSNISSKLLQRKRDNTMTERDQQMIEALREYYGDDPSLQGLFD